MNAGMIQILSSEVDFHPLSFGDPNGRLFFWKGQLYRGIRQERASFYKQLFQDGVVQNLISKGLLVETELTNLTLDGYELVLRHRRVPFVSYAYEWCAPMLKQAALAVIDIEMELARRDLTLQDAHPWNVLFDGCKPIYVDFGSIVPAQANTLWPAYDEFCRFFLYPLHLIVHGHVRIARWLLHDYDQGILKSDLTALTYMWSLRSEVRQTMKAWLETVKRHVPSLFRPALKKGYRLLKSALLKPAPPVPQSRLDFLRQVRQQVEDLAIPSVRTEWSGYYEDCYPSFAPSDEWTQKHRSVYQVLSELRPFSVLDIGSNRGWYSQLAALLGSTVVAFDVDEICVAQLYHDARDRHLQILPLVMDFRNPSPGYGLCNSWLTPATQRLRCDMVLALALVHHLVFKQHLNFEQIVEGLSIFSNRYLLLEFVPREDQYVREWWTGDYSWYTQDNLMTTLRQRFHSVKVYPSYPAPRVLLLCEK